MTYTRRDALAVGASGLALLAATRVAVAAASDDAIAEFTGGTAPGEGGITIKAPEIAENGNVVPVEVAAPGAAEIMLMAPENPGPVACKVRFGPMSGTQRLSTRIRLAKTQNVTAVARMADGSFVMTSQPVKVTVGGCGG